MKIDFNSVEILENNVNFEYEKNSSLGFTIEIKNFP